jgi:hypothetical protein
MALTHRQELILAALASRPGHNFAPVQVQKLFFLLDENIAAAMGGKQFAFEPYDYGPFDKAVYQELDALAHGGYVQVAHYGASAGSRRYALTVDGQEIGRAVLARLDRDTQAFVARLTEWVCTMSFAQLVGSIYRAYPHMRVNSIFQGLPSGQAR